MNNMQEFTRQDCPIAVVGMNGLFPEAGNIAQYWSNIISGKDCIKELASECRGYWRIEDYYNPDPKLKDKTYCKKAGIIPEIDFDPLEFNIPPMQLETISQDQLFSLVVAKRTFEDSGILAYSDRSRIGVILGVGEAGNVAYNLTVRSDHQNWRRVLENFSLPPEMITAILEKLKNLYPDWQESSFPGFLSNVVCGRITNYFNLGGPNYAVNAACASSFAAMKAAVSELMQGTCDAVLTGGVNLDVNSIISFLSFTKTPVISPSNCIKPYDEKGDGIMLGDCVSMLILKRLPDAERDGDKIYGVIRGIGTASDGKASSIYAPKLEGQLRALEQVYAQAGCEREAVSLVEGHGTGTAAGDLCEFQALNEIFKALPQQSIALGSVKSQIGHARIAAGAAAITKVLLALYHKVLPPTINVSTPNPKFMMEKSSLYLNTQARPWIKGEAEAPRTAGISAFGFGGTNFHVVVEEYSQPQPFVRFNSVPDMFFIQANSPAKLVHKCQQLLDYFSTPAAEGYYLDYLDSIKNIGINPDMPRLGFVTTSLTETCELLTICINLLTTQPNRPWVHEQTIHYRPTSLDLSGKVVALFPGYGAHYLNMATESVQNYPELRQAFELLDTIAQNKLGIKISPAVYPITTFVEEEKQRQKAQIQAMQYAAPAISAVSCGFYKLLQQAGMRFDFMLGQGIGVLTGLWAAGVLTEPDLFALVLEHAQLFGAKKLSQADAQIAWGKQLAATPFKPFTQPIYSANKGECYLQTPEDLVTKQLDLENDPETLRQAVEKVYAQGGKIFLEIGPRSILSQSVQKILAEKDCVCIGLNPESEQDSEQQFRQAVVQLMVAGVALKHIDPYRRDRVHKQAGAKKRLSYKLNGGTYLNPATLELRTAALENKTDLALNLFLNQQEDTIMQKDTISSNIPVPAEVLFHQNQEAYLKLAATLVHKQIEVIEKLNQHAHFTQILSSFTETHKLLEAAQLQYNRANGAFAEPQAPTTLGTPAAATTASQLAASSHGGQINGQLQPKDGQRLLERVTQLIAEKAGIKMDQVDVNADLELNLKLDIFKMLEISAVIKKEFLIDEAVAEKLFSLSTLAEMSDYILLNYDKNNGASSQSINVVAAVSPTQVASSNQSVAPKEQPPAQVALPQAQIEEMVSAILSIISEKTGYPTEVLEPNMDLNAELGVDSIKMVEILGAIQNVYPTLGIVDDPEELGKLRTVQQIAGFIGALQVNAANSNAANKTAEVNNTAASSRLAQANTATGMMGALNGGIGVMFSSSQEGLATKKQ